MNLIFDTSDECSMETTPLKEKVMATDGNSETPFVIEDDQSFEKKGKTGHEQNAALIFSLLLIIAALSVSLGFRSSHSEAYHWSWFAVTGIQTFFAFTLPLAYPGYAVFSYTAGLGNDGPATRFEAFYINNTMGMVLGIPNMAFVDHLMFLFAPFVMVLGWMPSSSIQVVASGLACLCGLYMALWIPTNIATGTKDPAPLILCSVFVACSFLRVFLPQIAFDDNHKLVLLIFNLILCVGVLLLGMRGIKRNQAGRVTKSIALTLHICKEIGDGPVWQAWPKGKDFPAGWWYEPPPFGKSNNNDGGWPTNGQWPLQQSTTINVPPEMVTAARDEMLLEIPHFIPLLRVLIGIFLPIIVLVAAAFSVS